MLPNPKPYFDHAPNPMVETDNKLHALSGILKVSSGLYQKKTYVYGNVFNLFHSGNGDDRILKNYEHLR